MTNKIIEVARLAGMTTGDNQKHNGEYWWRSLGRPTNVSTSDLARFYAIARAEALEDAAKVCDEQQTEGECPERASYCAEAIRSLKNQDAAIAAGKGEG